MINSKHALTTVTPLLPCMHGCSSLSKLLPNHHRSKSYTNARITLLGSPTGKLSKMLSSTIIRRGNKELRPWMEFVYCKPPAISIALAKWTANERWQNNQQILHNARVNCCTIESCVRQAHSQAKALPITMSFNRIQFWDKIKIKLSSHLLRQVLGPPLMPASMNCWRSKMSFLSADNITRSICCASHSHVRRDFAAWRASNWQSNA